MFDMFENYNNDSKNSENQENTAESSSSVSHFGNIFVISVGGSLLVKAKPDTEKIRAISEAISILHSQGKKVVVVVGGGKVAREYVSACDSLEINNFDKDMIGISVTRTNALLLANSIPECHKEILTKISDAKKILDSGKIPVFGGLMPFFTTDAVGALIAESLDATFVNLTNVDGVYTLDPRDYPDAKRYDEISYENLVSLVLSSGSKPGQNVVLDIACCMILQRSKIPAVVLDGNDIENFKNYVNGYSFVGTIICETGQEIDAQETTGKPARKGKTTKSKLKKAKKSKSSKYDDYETPDPSDIHF